jgi:hypothetical protein
MRDDALSPHTYGVVFKRALPLFFSNKSGRKTISQWVLSRGLEHKVKTTPTPVRRLPGVEGLKKARGIRSLERRTPFGAFRRGLGIEAHQWACDTFTCQTELGPCLLAFSTVLLEGEVWTSRDLKTGEKKRWRLPKYAYKPNAMRGVLRSGHVCGLTIENLEPIEEPAETARWRKWGMTSIDISTYYIDTIRRKWDEFPKDEDVPYRRFIERWSDEKRTRESILLCIPSDIYPKIVRAGSIKALCQAPELKAGIDIRHGGIAILIPLNIQRIMQFAPIGLVGPRYWWF